MKPLLLDTTFIIDVLRDRRARPALLETLIRQGHPIGCCAINITEVYAGLRPSEAQRTENFLSRLVYFELTVRTARLAGMLRQSWARQGITLSLADATIAAVCIEGGLTLLTDNQRHFPMPELSLYPLP